MESDKGEIEMTGKVKVQFTDHRKKNRKKEEKKGNRRRKRSGGRRKKKRKRKKKKKKKKGELLVYITPKKKHPTPQEEENPRIEIEKQLGILQRPLLIEVANRNAIRLKDGQKSRKNDIISTLSGEILREGRRLHILQSTLETLDENFRKRYSDKFTFYTKKEYSDTTSGTETENGGKQATKPITKPNIEEEEEEDVLFTPTKPGIDIFETFSSTAASTAASSAAPTPDRRVQVNVGELDRRSDIFRIERNEKRIKNIEEVHRSFTKQFLQIKGNVETLRNTVEKISDTLEDHEDTLAEFFTRKKNLTFNKRFEESIREHNEKSEHEKKIYFVWKLGVNQYSKVKGKYRVGGLRAFLQAGHRMEIMKLFVKQDYKKVKNNKDILVRTFSQFRSAITNASKKRETAAPFMAPTKKDVYRSKNTEIQKFIGLHYNELEKLLEEHDCDINNLRKLYKWKVPKESTRFVYDTSEEEENDTKRRRKKNDTSTSQKDILPPPAQESNGRPSLPQVNGGRPGQGSSPPPPPPPPPTHGSGGCVSGFSSIHYFDGVHCYEEGTYTLRYENLQRLLSKRPGKSTFLVIDDDNVDDLDSVFYDVTFRDFGKNFTVGDNTIGGRVHFFLLKDGYDEFIRMHTDTTVAIHFSTGGHLTVNDLKEIRTQGIWWEVCTGSAIVRAVCGPDVITPNMLHLIQKVVQSNFTRNSRKLDQYIWDKDVYPLLVYNGVHYYVQMVYRKENTLTVHIVNDLIGAVTVRSAARDTIFFFFYLMRKLRLESFTLQLYLHEQVQQKGGICCPVAVVTLLDIKQGVDLMMEQSEQNTNILRTRVQGFINTIKDDMESKFEVVEYERFNQDLEHRRYNLVQLRSTIREHIRNKYHKSDRIERLHKSKKRKLELQPNTEEKGFSFTFDDLYNEEEQQQQQQQQEEVEQEEIEGEDDTEEEEDTELQKLHEENQKNLKIIEETLGDFEEIDNEIKRFEEEMGLQMESDTEKDDEETTEASTRRTGKKRKREDEDYIPEEDFDEDEDYTPPSHKRRKLD